jgi:cation-transporting ATPase E
MVQALEGLTRIIGCLLIPVGIVLFCQAFFRQNLGMQTSVESMVAALVGMIPHGLYLLTGIVLAVTGQRLSHGRVLVQDVRSVEAAARADVLCVDKTGTITCQELEVSQIVPLTADPPERLEAVLTALCGSTPPETDTQRALAELFTAPSDWECRERIPFTAGARWSGAVFQEQGAFLLGDPASILDSRYPQLQPQVEDWTAKGYRVALAAQYHGTPEQGGLEDYRVMPLALIVLNSRIRGDAVQTFRELASQGIAIKVLSGDNAAAASEVALRCGIENAHCFADASLLLTESELADAAESCTVFGRVSPEQKRALVHALQDQGKTVMMVGDGVNDVLAMGAADCAVSLAGGAAAASQAADLVLLDGKLSGLGAVVTETRRVAGGIQRAAGLFLVNPVFSLGLALVCLATGWAYPLLPVHLSVVSVLTVGLPALLLALERNTQPEMEVFLPGVLGRALPGGLTATVAVGLAQVLGLVFAIPGGDLFSVCAALTALTGLLVLHDSCKPFNTFRTGLFWSMAAAVAVCFTVLGGFFGFSLGNEKTLLLLGVLLLGVPTVYRVLAALVRRGIRLAEKFTL